MNRLSRQQVIDELLPMMKQVLTKEQHERSVEYTTGLSDYKFDQLIAEILSMAGQDKQMDIKEFASLTEKVKNRTVSPLKILRLIATKLISSMRKKIKSCGSVSAVRSPATASTSKEKMILNSVRYGRNAVP